MGTRIKSAVIAVAVVLFAVGCGKPPSTPDPLGGGEGTGSGGENALLIDPGPNQTICAGAGAGARIGPLPTDGFIYTWTPLEGLSNGEGAQPIAAPEATTTYEVLAMDPDTGRTGKALVTVTVQQPPIARITSAPTSVCDGSPWFASAETSTASGSAEVVSYSWQFGDQSSDQMSPGFRAVSSEPTIPITLTVADSIGCVGTTSAEVALLPVPTANAGADKQIGLGAATSIGAPATGGTAPYTYAWTSASSSCLGAPCLSSALDPTPQVAPTADTEFTVQVTDSLGCQSEATVKVTVGPPLAANAGPNLGICEGDSAVIGQQATGGTPPYVYGWTSSSCGIACIDSPTTESTVVRPAQTSLFTQAVGDQAGTKTTASVTVSVSPHPGTAGSDETIDPGTSLAIGPNPVAGGTYAWSCDRPNCALSDPLSSRPNVTPVLSSRYTLSAQNGPTCSASSTKIVYVNLQQASAPAPGDPAFPVSSKLQVRFDQPILASTLNVGTVRLEDADTGTAIPVTLSYDAATQVLTVTPPPDGSNGYASLNDYTLTLAGGLNGIRSDDLQLPNRFPTDVLIDFTTGPADTVPPYVVFTNPANGAIGAATNSLVLGIFDAAVDPATITPSTVLLHAGTVAVAGTVQYDFASHSVTFTPAAPLAITTHHTLSILGVKDLSGNVGNLSWSFTTGAPDTTPPQVVGVSPPDGATGVLASSVIELTFSEPIDPTTLGGLVITNVLAGASVPGTATFNPITRVATFTSTSVLEGQALHRVTVSGVQDLAGNAIAAPFASTFTTARRLFFDNFETGTGRWTLPFAGTSAWETVTNTYRSATHSLHDSPLGKYQSNTVNVAELKYPIPVGGLSFVSVQFSLRLRAEKSRDQFFVDYRVDGEAWVALNRPGTNSGWAGNLTWSTFTLPIPTAGKSILELRLRMVSNANRNFDGAYVDDVTVQAP